MRARSFAAATAAVAAGTGCVAALAAPHPGATPPKFLVTEVRGSISRLHDSHPVSARFVLTHRQHANEVLDGAGVNSNQLVYAVVVKGRFTVSRPGPDAQGTMRVPVVFYIFDARTGRETDGGFGKTVPALSKLGTVHNLLPYLLRR